MWPGEGEGCKHGRRGGAVGGRRGEEARGVVKRQRGVEHWELQLGRGQELWRLASGFQCSGTDREHRARLRGGRPTERYLKLSNPAPGPPPRGSAGPAARDRPQRRPEASPQEETMKSLLPLRARVSPPQSRRGSGSRQGGEKEGRGVPPDSFRRGWAPPNPPPGPGPPPPHPFAGEISDPPHGGRTAVSDRTPSRRGPRGSG